MESDTTMITSSAPPVKGGTPGLGLGFGRSGADGESPALGFHVLSEDVTGVM